MLMQNDNTPSDAHKNLDHIYPLSDIDDELIAPSGHKHESFSDRCEPHELNSFLLYIVLKEAKVYNGGDGH